jgi:hypothetical protein
MVRAMKKLAFVFVLWMPAACGPSNYAYSFDLTDPGARNLQRPGQRDVIEDADVRSEILVDPTSFQAILLDITNKTDQTLSVNWSAVSIIGPDGTQTPLHPDSAAPSVEPNARLVSRLVPFVLPSQGSPAAAYNNSTWELVVPMVIRGQPREYRYHLRAQVHTI